MDGEKDTPLDAPGSSGREMADVPAQPRLRIAYLFMRYPSSVQPFALSDVAALTELGHEVDVYALSRRDPRHDSLVSGYSLRLPRRSHLSIHTLAAILKPANWSKVLFLKIFLLRHASGWRDVMKAFLLLPRIVEVAAELERTKPDVVHAFWGHYPSLVLPLLRRVRPDGVLSIFLGAYDLTSHLSAYSIVTAEACDTVWTHSEANRPILTALGIDPATLHVAHRGIPLDLAAGDLPAKVPFRILTAANLQREKNVDLVLRVFRAVLDERPQATLVVAGDGDERAALEALSAELGVADRVTFTGLLKREKLFREMAAAQVFLFLSTKVSERLPNVVKEAMLAGCHCVVSQTPGIRELVAAPHEGDIVTDLAPAALAARICEIFRHGPADVGVRAAEKIRREFSAEQTMRVYADGWQSARRRRRGSGR